MHGQQLATAEQAEGLERMLRAEVNVTPRFVERAHLEQHQIERAETLLDLAVLGRKPGVPTEDSLRRMMCAFVVDNSISFQSIKNPMLLFRQDWSQIRVPALPKKAIERLEN
jgi:hypothetical protein